MNRNIIILTNSTGIVPQTTHETIGIDLNLLFKGLIKNNFHVERMTFDQFLLLDNVEIQNTYFIYASSQYSEYKNYIQDVLLNISLQGGVLIPNFSCFSAHENKAFQELEKKRLDIKSPKSHIIGTYEEGINYIANNKFPFLLKKPTGFGSRGVILLKSYRQAKKELKKNISNLNIFNRERLEFIYRKYKYKNSYPFQYGKLIFQEFIPGIDFDWKVLVFGKRCFALKRYVRKNDFRASGSGDFEFGVQPDDYVFDFAYEIKNKLSVPWVSLDILVKDQICYLIEYQTIHFGMVTAIKNPYYFEKNSGRWVKKNNDLRLESYMIEALIESIGEYKANN